MFKLTVTTIRHELSENKLSEIISQYQTNEELLKRVNIESLLKRNFSRVVIDENGYKIETVVAIDKE